MVDSLWEGCRESRSCSRDTYPESYITKYTRIRRITFEGPCVGIAAYSDTSLIRNRAPLGPYGRDMPRPLWWS